MEENTNNAAVNAALQDKRIVAGVLAILVGWLGIHKFYLGYTMQGVIMLLVSLLSAGILSGIVWLIGIIEGILYLTKTPEQFKAEYVDSKRPWF